MRRVLLLAALLALTAAVAVPALASGHAKVTCKKHGMSSCTARISLKGGASNKVITVNLPGKGWSKDPTVTVSKKSLKGAYSLTGGTFSSGGSVYTATLNAVQSIRGGYLKLTFKH
jgi:hypothetical protein